jgi:hypothetical protein
MWYAGGRRGCLPLDFSNKSRPALARIEFLRSTALYEPTLNAAIPSCYGREPWVPSRDMIRFRFNLLAIINQVG